MSKPTILVVNDDGISARGIRALVEAMKEIGNVTVVAPDSPQSGMGHAITIHNPLRLDKVDIFKDVDAWQCSGTPVDCVKLAVNKILNRKPDICVSGINHGSNSSINVIYSGTMSAAMEGAIEGIPSIGFSLVDFNLDADLTAAKHYAGLITRTVLKGVHWKELLLNVNIPNLPLNEMKGVKICRQAMAKWKEEFEERQDPSKQKYFWLTGKFINPDLGEDTDEWALANGYVSVVPVEFDFTAHHAIPRLNKLSWND
ncbi:MAG TPA: 5'/3'-nucleotidase SurE [Bacteroidia bacterium]|nr:MAG: stationary phase survival protein SurE [Bacteroidetes bacterium OLB10]MBE7511130.1 5'/3'-nucleotidase SurE [Bacteroidia bacterium]MBX3105558.1 5'/3'-nucleotidase SurE [Bacteroidota bacterium]MCE7954884.1 5'/3'-nucleotidase SurE [Bacteroidetes bacterium CHB6]OQB63901.1 MAG: 5'-nucleotidase SurE [Bacteroidetes bacterium ADurb.Bin141]